MIRDTCIGAANCRPTTRVVSVAQNGDVGNGSSGFAPAISADGRFVAFISIADNIAGPSPNQLPEAYVRDTCLGIRSVALCIPHSIRVSGAASGWEPRGAIRLSMSSDAQVVVFASTDGAIYFRQTCIAIRGCTPFTRQIARSGDVPAVSGNGRFVAFASNDRTITAPEALRPNVYAYDSCFGALNCTPSFRRVSVSQNGEEHNGFIVNAIFQFFPLAISSSGHAIAFTCSASNLVPTGPQNVTWNVFLAPSRF